MNYERENLGFHQGPKICVIGSIHPPDRRASGWTFEHVFGG